MSKVQLKPGDYVLTEGMTEEQYWDVYQAFLAAGCPSDPRGLSEVRLKMAKIVGWGKVKFDVDMFVHASCTELLCLNGCQYTIDQVLGKEDPEEWNGEGLPPVGAVVEVVDAGYGIEYGENLIGKNAEVKAWVHQKTCDVAVLDYEGGLYCFRSEMLRPIRSEREKAVEEAMKDIGAEDGDFASILAAVERMVAAGYRKEKS